LEDQALARTLCLSFLTDQFHNATQTRCPRLIAPHIDHRRQKLHQQWRIRTIEAEISAQHPHRHWSGLGAMMSFTRRIEVKQCRTEVEIARKRETRHRGKQNEVALLEFENANTIEIEKA